MNDYHNKFTPEQEKWLSELESGKHKQATGELYNGEGYCCLGVAARFVLGLKPIDNNGYYKLGNNAHVLCTKDANKLRLFAGGGTIRSRYRWAFAQVLPIDTEESLAEYNDNGATFAQIAAAIRAMPWAVFTNFDEEAQCTKK